MQINRITKCITCHAGARDEYQLSLALDQKNYLETLVTDLYIPNSIQKYFKKRHNTSLSSKKVTSLYRNFVLQKLFNLSYEKLDTNLSNKVFGLVQNKSTTLFLSSYTAYEAFNKIKSNNLNNLLLLFQIHPHPLSVNKILRDEIDYVPIAKKSILNEQEININTSNFQRLIKEPLLANKILVASTFTKNTLIENGVISNNITVVPYGVYHNNFKKKDSYNINGSKFNIVFVGQLIQRKGLFYLFEALKKLNNPNINLTITGRGYVDDLLLKEYSFLKNIKIYNNITKFELRDLLSGSDLFVFPSLIEGFGHVILEAMSCGLPVICTPNTAGKDLFITENEGFIVPIRDIDALVNKIDWAYCNRKFLKEMGEQAHETSKLFTWEKFREGVIDFYEKAHE
jgi:glycosyltransferase involved in cell wall biosynthesis